MRRGRVIVLNRRGVRRQLFRSGLTVALVAVPAVASAATGIDAGGMRIYSTIVSIGKWVIVVKGVIDCIQAVLAGDFQMAKRQFFGYIMCFAIMLGLPWSMNEIERIFQ
jgi:hypothetical protein